MLSQQNTFQQPFFKLILICSLLIFAVNLFLRYQIIFFHEIEIGGIELNVIDGIMKILTGNFLYTDPALPPYDIIQYSPLYYYLVAGIAKILNVSFADPQNIFILTRSVALIANLLTMVVVFIIARNLLLSKLNSILSGIFSFIILTQHYYSRGDSFYCLLFFIAIYFFLKYLDDKRNLFLVLFSITSFLCILTKQSGIIIPVTIGIFILVKKDYIALVRLTFYFISLAVVFVFFLDSIGGLENTYRNVVLGVKNGMSLFLIESFFNDKYFMVAAPWVLTGFYLYSGAFKKVTDNRYSFLLTAIISTLLFAFISGLKIGSSLNYFIESIILIFLAGLMFIRDNQKKYFRIFLYGYFLFTIIFKTAGLFSAIHISHFRKDNYSEYLVEKEISEYMLNDLKIGKQDYVLLNYRGFTELFLTGNSIWNQKDMNFMVYVHASPEIDFTSFINQADHGLIKYIIAKEPIENVNLLGNPFYNFRPIKSIGDYTIYKYTI